MDLLTITLLITLHSPQVQADVCGDINAPAGEVTMSIRKELTDIQYGRLPDRHGWLVKLHD